MNIKKAWYMMGGSSFRANLLLLVYGQSNEGTDTTENLEATGQTPYANMPAYLSGMSVANIDFIKVISGTPTITNWAVNASVAWGWLNQVLYVCSQRWTDVIYAKRAVGGTTILPGGLGTFDRTTCKTILLSGVTAANARWGVGNYNVVILGGLCETNGLSQADGEALEAGLEEWWADLRTNVSNAAIGVKQFGTYQDIAFTFGVPYVQTSLINATNDTSLSTLITGGSNAKWELSDQADDPSHYNAAGSISLGNRFAEYIISLFGTSKSDATVPILQSAIISSGAPKDIVLTYDKTLNTIVPPFWADWSVAGSVSNNRKVITTVISGATVTLTFSENFYSGETVALTYTKKGYYESCICDLLGNEAANLSAYSVTNNSSTTSATVSARYTSNFSAGVDSWLTLSGGQCAAVDGIGGLDDVLEFSGSDTTPIIYRNSILTGTISHVYRMRLKIYVPFDILETGVATRDYDIRFTNSAGAVQMGTLYPYIRRNVLGSQWVNIEYTWTEVGAGTAVRIEMSNITIGQKIYFKDFQVDRLS